MSIKKEAQKQFEYLKKGSTEIIQEKELLDRLEHSLKNNRPLKVKAGFDPTAPDIHVGHTVLLRKMKHFQDLGHEVIFLIGDFTGLIGDPSGQSKTRPSMTREQIKKNAQTYKNQVFKILNPDQTIIEFNSKWLGKLTSFDIIHLMAKYTVARILERDDFSERLEKNKPIGTHEILYPIMQAYDSVALEADVELGGTDQKFNLLVGRDIQKEYDQKPQIVLTMPLLEGTDGVEKMSKSLDNYIGISESPTEIYGKVMSISDSLMYRYYELLTDLPISTIQEYRKKSKQGEVNPKDLKSELAKSIVQDFWSRKEAEKAAREFERVFKQNKAPSNMESIFASSGKTPVIDLLTDQNIFSSRGEAKRMIRQGAVYLDNQRITDIGFIINLSGKEEAVLKVGKKRFYKIEKK
ncbi:MAG: tyrosine--tRNA ligase [Candidatus Aminicenantes bacterium]|nr:tyrosine--tRNA ligase [Candidatus Aminicenantes bacterium]